MKKIFEQATEKGHTLTTTTLTAVNNVVEKTTTSVDGYIAPVRKSALARFPILFSLLTTFGVATTFLGFEKIISSVPVLNNHPLLLLIVGISILAVTGTLYKKLR